MEIVMKPDQAKRRRQRMRSTRFRKEIHFQWANIYFRKKCVALLALFLGMWQINGNILYCFPFNLDDNDERERENSGRDKIPIKCNKTETIFVRCKKIGWLENEIFLFWMKKKKMSIAIFLLRLERKFAQTNLSNATNKKVKNAMWKLQNASAELEIIRRQKRLDCKRNVASCLKIMLILRHWMFYRSKKTDKLLVKKKNWR